MNSLAIDKPWPAEQLEQVAACPYCKSSEKALAYSSVQDWSFGCAAGKWTYWDCLGCRSLYLHPRPTVAAIGAAYANYYTHNSAAPASFISKLKERLRNEYFSHQLNASIEPRLHAPTLFRRLVVRMGANIVTPFGWKELATRPGGRFMDIGCGAGHTVYQAQQFGWDAMGLEVDPAAVKAARSKGANIVEGTYEKLAEYEGQFDCILCSHVLEHVHDPKNLLALAARALKPGGSLLITLPNALSALRHYFGADWRGLEAPRHLAIASQPQLEKMLRTLGFHVQSAADNRLETAAESFRIRRRSLVLTMHDMKNAQRLRLTLDPLSQSGGNDFTKLICELMLAKDDR